MAAEEIVYHEIESVERISMSDEVDEVEAWSEEIPEDEDLPAVVHIDNGRVRRWDDPEWESATPKKATGEDLGIPPGTSWKSPTVRVGVGVVVVKFAQVLVGLRKGSHAAGKWSFPGGHLELGESIDECAERELDEECGEDLKVELLQLKPDEDVFLLTNDMNVDISPDGSLVGLHCITLFLAGNWISGEPVVGEPDKCDGWKWVGFEELRQMDKRGELAPWISIEKLSKFVKPLGL